MTSVVLPWLSEQGLFTQDPDGCLLETFPEEQRVKLISTTIGFLSAQPAAIAALQSEFQVKWVLETMAAAMNLPIEHNALISMTARIYCYWLVKPETGPPALATSYDTLAINMLKHVSLIFHTHCRTPAALLPAHVTICREILMSLNQLPFAKLPPQATNTLLGVLLGVSDGLLHHPETVNLLGDSLCDLLVQTLLEIWIKVCHLCFPDTALWQSLFKFFRRWRHRAKTVAWWCVVARGLTSRLKAIMQGKPRQKLKPANAVKSFQTAVAAMEPEVVLHCWRAIFRLIGDPLGGKDLEALKPEPFLELMTGLSSVVSDLLEPEPGAAVPSGNSIMKLLGKWLYSAAQLQDVTNDDPYLAGRAAAIGALCEIVCKTYSHDPSLKKEYVDRFFYLVLQGLRHPQIAPEVLINTQNVFTLDLDGLLVLVQPMLRACRRVLTSKDSAVSGRLRRSAVVILRSIVAFPNHYPDVVIRPCGLDSTANPSPELNLSAVKGRVVDILLQGLEVEADQATIPDYLHTLLLSVLDEEAFRAATAEPAATTEPAWISPQPHRRRAVSKPDKPHTSTTSTLRTATSLEDGGLATTSSAGQASAKLPAGSNSSSSGRSEEQAVPQWTRRLVKQMSQPKEPRGSAKPPPPPTMMVVKVLGALTTKLASHTWSLPVDLAVFETLQSLVALHELIAKCDPNAVPRLIETLCKYIEHQIRRPPPQQTRKLHSAIVSAYHCLLCWINANPTMTENRDLLSYVVQSAMFGLVGTSASMPEPQTEATRRSTDWKLDKGGLERLQRRASTSRILPSGSPSFRVQEAASLLLRCIENELDRPNSSIFGQQEQELQQSGDPDRLRYYFIHQHTIVGIMTLTHQAAPCLVLIVRDAAGRHCYNITPQWRLSEGPRIDSPSSSGRSSVSAKSFTPRPQQQPKEATAKNDLVISHTDVSRFLNKSKDELSPVAVRRTRSLSTEKQSQLLDRMCKQQLEVEQAHGLGMEEVHFASTPVAPVRRHNPTQQGQALLVQLGLLSLEDLVDHVLESQSPLEPELLQELNNLDALPQRKTLGISVYQLDGSLKPVNGSQRDDDVFVLYHDLRTLHPIGFKAAAPDYQEASHQPKDAILLTPTIEAEVRLAVALNLQPPKPSAHKQELHLVYLSSLSQAEIFDPTLIKADDDAIVMVVSKLDSGLFYVRNVSLSSAAHVGPIFDWVVLSETILADVIRQQGVAVMLDRFVKDDKFVLPHVARKRMIQKMADSQPAVV
eukprot:m.211509 g.211509  ORF g.211509 m.211509 type:complete len:1244 (+) comp17150_c0_seq2:64-3795(+)